MKFTNKANLPEGIVNAIINDTYDKGKADYSVSQLNMPPQMLWLIRKHWDDITVDVSDEIWKLLGSNVHYILEKSQDASIEKIAEIRKYKLEEIQRLIKEAEPNMDLLSQIKTVLSQEEPKPNPFLKTEERFYGSLGGIVISGKPDWYELLSKKIEDYKITSVWKILKGDYEDYESQLNMYKWLLNENDFDVTQLQINAILKDWKKYEITRDENYPKIPVVKLEIPVWGALPTVRYILDKVEKHETARYFGSAEEVAKHYPCTNKEKWHGEDKFAVKKPENSRASKVFDTKKEAQEFVDSNSGYIIEERLGVDKRCEEFCLVRDFCAQYRKEHRDRTVNISDKPADLDEDVSIPAEHPEVKITTKKEEDGVTVVDKVEDVAEEKKEESFNERWEKQKKDVADHLDKQKREQEENDKKDDDSEDLFAKFGNGLDEESKEDDSDEEDISDILGGLGL